MKAQKLGLVLGMNMAVACMVMQGCKAVKPETDLPPPETTTIEQPAQQPADQPVVTEIETTTTPAPSVPGGATHQETMPTPAPTTRTVSKLPPPAKPAETKKPAAAPAAPAPAAATIHTVKKGEMLSSISKKYNVKMSAIVAANPGLNPDRIRIGQKLNIPGASAAPKSNVMLAAAPAPAAGVAPAAANTTAPVKVKPAFKPYTGPTKEYVVKGGDSLGKIALANGITIRALKDLNGLTKDNIRPGQKLKVPAEKVTAEKKAEAPAEKKAEAPAAEKKDAAKANAAAPEKKEEKPAEPAPAAGTAAPAAAEPAPVADAPKADAAPAEPAAPAAEPAANTYVVKEGDDVVSVSIAWGISPSQLMNANDLKDSDQLKPGQVLKLPPNARQTVQ